MVLAMTFFYNSDLSLVPDDPIHLGQGMSLSASDILKKIMEKAINTSDHSGSALKPYHVSQTADQLPDFKVRNAFYRSELERQIQEKRETERRRKEREAYEEERLIQKLEYDREKVRREYLDEIEKRKLMKDEAERRQHIIVKRLEELQEVEERKKEVEERKKEEEEQRRRQQAIIEKRIADIKEAVEIRKEEEIEKRRQRILYEKFYGTGLPYSSSTDHLSKYYDNYRDLKLNSSYYKRPWNSRDYVHSGLQPDMLLEDVYFDTPLPILADVYKKLDEEKKRIKEIMRQRIIQGETSKYNF